MSFLDDYDRLAQTIQDPVQLATQQAGLTRQWLTARTDEMFAELRYKRPIFVAPRLACVAAHADVREVLQNDRVFSVRPYVVRMERTTGAFFLGMEKTAQYEREVSIVRLTAGRDDISRIKQLVATVATHNFAVGQGRLDLVDGYARAAAIVVVQRYFGVPGPSAAVLGNWMRIIFWDIFQNLGDDPAVRQLADVA